MNRELMMVSNWMTSNGLTLNVNKCNYILFRRKQRVFPELLDDIHIGGRKLDRLSSTKYLGLIFDENLTWSAHVNHVTRKVSRYVPLLYNVRHKLSRENLRLIYNSIIYPMLMYGNVVWGGCCKAHLNSLKVVQKKILRIMSFKGKFEHTAPLFTAFNILPIDQVNSYMCLIYVYRCLKNETDNTFLIFLFTIRHGWQKPVL